MLFDILELAERGLCKTRIVYEANLNFRLADTYFDFLVSKGYLAKTWRIPDAVGRSQLTERGERLLELLRGVQNELACLFSEEPYPVRKSITPGFDLLNPLYTNEDALSQLKKQEKPKS